MATPAVYEVNNIAPSDLNIEILRSYNRERIAAAKRFVRRMFRDKLPRGYINRAFKRFKTGFLYTDPERHEIKGFCVWRPFEYFGYPDDHKYIHIYLLYGGTNALFEKNIFSDLDRYCEENGIEFMELNVANKHLMKEYYESYGFAATDTLRPYIFAKPVRTVFERRARGRGATRRSEAREERRRAYSGKQGDNKLTFRKNNRGVTIEPDNATVL